MVLKRITRRELLFAGLAGGAAFGVGVYGGFRLGRRDERRRRVVPPRTEPFAPDAFVAIDERGHVRIWLAKLEAGQGVMTSLPMIVVEELGADPAQVEVVQAPADDAYGDQGVGISYSVRGSFTALRTAGAAAREMLIAVAADALGVPATECATEFGAVVHAGSGRRVPFGTLVRAAGRRPVPQQPTLKARDAFRHLGRKLPRLDLPAKLDGSARFGLDVRVAGMAFATIARCPTIGGKLVRHDATAARAVPGVRDVVVVERGVAVVADHSHAAIRGREALTVEWDRGPNARFDDAAITALLDANLAADGAIARRDGRGAEALAGAGRVVSAEYRMPYLAHATMEPMNCTADVRADGCTIWAPTQSPGKTRDEAARRLGIDRSKVEVVVTFAGGAFGRRVEDDFLFEALDVSKAVGRPVQVLWTRDDDLIYDWFRPCSAHRLDARLGDDGRPVAWRHRIVAPSLIHFRDPGYAGPPDPIAVEGAADLAYAIGDLQVEYVRADLPFRIGFWRSVGHSYNAFATECFVDEIAAAGGQDPIALRRTLLTSRPRDLAVLDRAVALAGTAPTGAGRGRGVAVMPSYGSHVAMVADVTTTPDGSVVVDRVAAAVDCGLAVDPDGIAAQIEGGIVFGLTAMLHGRIGFDQGAPTATNFDSYPLLRFDAMPEVVVATIDGAPDALGGVGEIGVPPIAPAVGNAIFAASGRRVRSLPLRSS